VLLTGNDRGAQVSPSSAQAVTPSTTPSTAPGTTPGKLAYGLNGDIYVANWDGSDPVRIANGTPFGPANDSYWGEGHLWSPDGRYLAYRRDTGGGGSHRETVFISDPRGHLVASFPGQGWLISWSPDSTRVASWVRLGRTIGIYGLDGVRQRLLTLPQGLMAPGDFDPVWSPDGASLLVPRGVQIPLDGSAPRHLPAADPRSHWIVRYSPVGARVAYSDYVSPTELVVAVADGSQARVLVPGVVENAVWSPTGDRIAFDAPTGKGMTAMGPTNQIRVVDVASGKATPLTAGSKADRVIGFSPDGNLVLFSRTNAKNRSSLWTVRTDGSAPQRLVTGTDWGEWQP
jgi:Tol biopolymer transport system component